MKSSKKTKSDLNTSGDFLVESVSLADIVLVFASNFKLFILIPLTFCIITIFYVIFIAKPVYTSKSKIMSSSAGGSMSQAVGLAAQFGINLSSNQSEPKWVYPEILRSRTLAKAVLKKKFDTEKFGSQKSLLQILNHTDNLSKSNIIDLESIATEKLLGMIKINEDVKTGILTLNIIASEAKLSSEINKVLIEELDSHQRRYNKAKTSDAKKFIEDRIRDTEKELMAAEEDLKVFMDRNRRIENSPALLLEQQRLGREVTVLTGVFTTLKQQLETTKIEEVKESDYVVVIDPPEIPMYRSAPNRKAMVVLAGIFGLSLCSVFVFIKDYVIKKNDNFKFLLNEIKFQISKNLKELISFKLNNNTF
tara:strand:+ start:109 stop:1200 length:1092 start_codon:yes stop_codon:yes gene_type:complete